MNNERIKDIYVLFTATSKEESKIMMRIKKVILAFEMSCWKSFLRRSLGLLNKLIG